MHGCGKFTSQSMSRTSPLTLIPLIEFEGLINVAQANRASRALHQEVIVILICLNSPGVLGMTKYPKFRVSASKLRALNWVSCLFSTLGGDH